jgi:hypothetical protein
LPLFAAAAQWRASEWRKARILRGGRGPGKNRAHAILRYLFELACMEYSSRRKRLGLGADAQIPESDMSVMDTNAGFLKSGNLHNELNAMRESSPRLCP